MSKPTKPVFGPNEFDTRVRERYLANGHLDAKVLEKHLADLKDSAASALPVELGQPALQGAQADADAD
ncbi:MAG: hypothetical protein U0414_37665 [Polyangiaceae bacterium]